MPEGRGVSHRKGSANVQSSLGQWRQDFEFFFADSLLGTFLLQCEDLQCLVFSIEVVQFSVLTFFSVTASDFFLAVMKNSVILR